MNLRTILARRAEIRDRLAAILEDNGTDQLTDETRAEADALEAEAGRLNDTERRVALLDDLARGAAGRRLDGGGSSGSRMELRVFTDALSQAPASYDGSVLLGQDGARVPLLEARHRLTDFLPASESRASAAAALGLGGFLRALYHGASSDLERRALAEGATGAGGATVPAPLSAEIIDLLRARSVAFRAGCRTVPMSSQTLRFARITADPAGSWRAENSSITVADPTFDAVTLQAKSWALIVKVSRELLEDAINLDSQLRNVFGRVAANALDTAILFGSGASSQPLGIAGTSGIQTVSLGTNGSQFQGWAPLLDAALSLDLANAGDITAMVLSPRTARAISGLQDATGNPLQLPARLSNVPILATTSASTTETQGTSSVASSILLGDFREVYVGLRTQLQVSVLTERFADNGQIGYVLWMRGDVAVAHPAALARVQGIIP